MKKPYSSQIHALEMAISRLEGWAFGRAFEFSTAGHVDEMRIDGPEDGRFEYFRQLPGLREFAAEMNAATLPIRDAYAKRLRQEMVNECAKVAAAALGE